MGRRGRLVDGAGDGGGGRGGRRQRGRAVFEYLAGRFVVVVAVASKDLKVYGCPCDGAGVEGEKVRQGRLLLLRVGIRSRWHDRADES